MTRLALVVPAYNEARRLPDTLAAISDFRANEPHITLDVILVDDGSTDNTPQLAAADPTIRLLRLPRNIGKGAAVQHGILNAADSDLILMSDTDCSAPLLQWRLLKQAIDAGADIAIGSRRLPGSLLIAPPPLLRRVASRIFSQLIRLAGVRGIRDTQCGFKLFRTPVALQLFPQLQCPRFAFDVELLARAQRAGYTVAEVPIAWNYAGHSSVNLLSHGSRMLLDLLAIILRSRKS